MREFVRTMRHLRPRSKVAAGFAAAAIIIGGAIPAGLVGALLGPVVSHNSSTAEDAAHAAARAKRAAKKAKETARQSRELSCQIGALLVGAPVEQRPAQSHHAFIQDVRTATAMLRSLKETNCEDVKGAGITAVAIQRQIRRFREAAPHGSPNAGGGGEASTSGSSPPSSPPGGGHTGGHAPPPDEPPPTTTTPPPTTTTTTPPPPPPGGCPPGTVARVNAAGIRICVRVPFAG